MLYGVNLPSIKEAGYRAAIWYVVNDFEYIGRFASEFGHGDNKFLLYLEIPNVNDTQRLTALNDKFAIPMYPVRPFPIVIKCNDASESNYDIKECDKLIDQHRKAIERHINNKIYIFY